jgi:hypothetical protein
MDSFLKTSRARLRPSCATSSPGFQPEEAAVLGLMRKRLNLEIHERMKADV